VDGFTSTLTYSDDLVAIDRQPASATSQACQQTGRAEVPKPVTSAFPDTELGCCPAVGTDGSRRQVAPKTKGKDTMKNRTDILLAGLLLLLAAGQMPAQKTSKAQLTSSGSATLAGLAGTAGSDSGLEVQITPAADQQFSKQI
jgi:hypothetical protein